MGMCSRQDRIQKDIDVVIQKSRAEDCLFADFRYSDSTFTFTYVGGPRRLAINSLKPKGLGFCSFHLQSDMELVVEETEGVTCMVTATEGMDRKAG
uniref:Protein mono-ADP-ribosyltransferase PARP8 n=1 Tax=Pan troglodytes TaxID=9598 RepID=A0A2I3SPM0_PANTR